MPRALDFESLIPNPLPLPSPGPGELAERRRRLGAALSAAGLEALLMEHGQSEFYFCGRNGWVSERLSVSLVLADGRELAVAPAFEATFLAPRLGPGVELLPWEEHEYGYDLLAARLSELGVRRLGLDGAVRQAIARRLADAGRQRGLALQDASPLVEGLRALKSPVELALIRRANALTQRAIEAVAATLEPGLTDLEISARLHQAQRRLGLVDTWDLTLIGPKSAEPHGQPDGTRLARGDVLLIDTGGVLGGYRSDLTRTFVFDGRPSADFERAWATVRAAQRAAFESLQVGAPCGAVDRAARAVIDAHGFGPGYRLFTHRLGHGIGLEIHEAPYLDGGSEVPLAAGMCFTNEPGLYQRGRFGLRLESVMAVGQAGPSLFGGWQAAPTGPEALELEA
jgi:Xaa-Pro dipeptidase